MSIFVLQNAKRKLLHGITPHAIAFGTRVYAIVSVPCRVDIVGIIGIQKQVCSIEKINIRLGSGKACAVVIDLSNDGIGWTFPKRMIHGRENRVLYKTGNYDV